MVSIRSGMRQCSQCGSELESGTTTCPQCGFQPKEKGLRVALGLLMIVVLSVTVTMFVPGIGPLLVRVAALSFLLCTVVFFVSMFATPYRFGRLFLRP
jgi:hypothetical protein